MTFRPHIILWFWIDSKFIKILFEQLFNIFRLIIEQFFIFFLFNFLFIIWIDRYFHSKSCRFAKSLPVRLSFIILNFLVDFIQYGPWNYSKITFQTLFVTFPLFGLFVIHYHFVDGLGGFSFEFGVNHIFWNCFVLSTLKGNLVRLNFLNAFGTVGSQ